jgi:hypothetical protein
MFKTLLLLLAAAPFAAAQTYAGEGTAYCGKSFETQMEAIHRVAESI